MIELINTWRMHEGYSSRSVCVSVYVCYHASCYILPFLVEDKVSLSFLWRFLHIHYVDLVENALFRTYGDICRSSLPSLLLDRLTKQIAMASYQEDWCVK